MYNPSRHPQTHTTYVSSRVRAKDQRAYLPAFLFTYAKTVLYFLSFWFSNYDTWMGVELIRCTFGCMPSGIVKECIRNIIKLLIFGYSSYSDWFSLNKLLDSSTQPSDDLFEKIYLWGILLEQSWQVCEALYIRKPIIWKILSDNFKLLFTWLQTINFIIFWISLNAPIKLFSDRLFKVQSFFAKCILALKIILRY